MTRYRNIETGEMISMTDYIALPYHQRVDFKEVDNSGEFITSAIIGAATGSSLLGGIMGGDIVGGIVGDLLDGDLWD